MSFEKFWQVGDRRASAGTTRPRAAPRQHPALARLDHRPWPLPAGAWAWRQSWLELLFAHWPVAPATLRNLLAPGLELDLYDGRAWVGVVPFRMEGVSRRPLPDLPWLSAFPELNVRTYVTRAGMPGVWFLSLDAANPLAVWAARRWFHLPYHLARMSVRYRAGAVCYESRRPDRRAKFVGRYQPTGEPFSAAPGTLEHWLTERYCLYASRPDGRLTRTQVHHAPWPLQPAEARIEENTMLAVHGLVTGPEAPLLHYARRLDVVVWRPELLDRGPRAARPC